MKTQMSRPAALLAGIAAVLTACTTTPEILPEPAQITIRAVLPEDAPVKVTPSVPESGKGLAWNWESTDQLTVIGATTETFRIKPGFSAKQAEFTGNPVSGSTFTILYPGTCTSIADAEALDWTDQVQNGNGSADHVRYVAALQGVDAYEEFSFDAAWAAAHGGTLRQSGALKFTLALPEGVDGVKSLKASAPRGYAISLELENVTLGSDRILIAYAGFPWNDLDVPAGAALKVSVETEAGGVWSKDLTLTANSTLASGRLNQVKINAEQWYTEGRYAGGEGTEANPWLIANATHMVHMNEDLTSGTCKYFKLIADVDMADVSDWNPSNAASPYDKQVWFDGNNHTISNFHCSAKTYCSLFGVLYGTIKDTRFKDAVINSSSASCGLIGGYLATGSFSAVIDNVDAEGLTINSAYNFVGGYGGQAINATLRNCDVTGLTVTGAASVGGLVGYTRNVACTFENCTVQGTVTATGGNAGGILGQGAITTNLSACGFEGSVSGGDTSVGGIVGYLNFKTAFTLSRCSSKGAVEGKKNSVGGIVGAIFAGTISDCWSTADVSGVQNVSGIVANIQGNGTQKTTLTRCLYRDGTITSTGASCGGVIGVAARNIEVSECANLGGTINAGGNWAGGFAGRIDGRAENDKEGGSKVTDCYVSGTVTGKAQRTAGFVGQDAAGYLALVRCIANCSSVQAQVGVGGLIGNAVAGNSEEKFAKRLYNSVEKCIAWTPFVKATGGTTSQWGSGAIIGAASREDALTDNYRNPALTLAYISATDWPLLYDQENVSETAPLKFYDGTSDASASGWAQTHYHGKAALAGSTLIAVAKELEYPESVWNLSGDVPVLKNLPQAE